MSNNSTSSPYEDCIEVSNLCPVDSLPTGGVLSFPASLFFLITFATCLLLQFAFGIKARTWSFMIWIGIGTSFEAIGHWARVGLSQRPWNANLFIAQYMVLLLAPTFVAAAISVVFKHIVLWYGQEWSILRPSLYPWVFVGTEILTIIIQFVGTFAFAAGMMGDGNPVLAKIGSAAIVGGVAFQLISMVFCMGLLLVYWSRRRDAESSGLELLHHDPTRHLPLTMNYDANRTKTSLSRADASAKEANRARLFVIATAIAYPAIAIRCAYRILEHIPSIADNIRTNEPLFLTMDSGMILIAVLAMTIFHPCFFFPFLGVKKQHKKTRQNMEEQSS